VRDDLLIANDKLNTTQKLQSGSRKDLIAALNKAKDKRDKYRLLFKHLKVHKNIAACKLEKVGKEMMFYKADALAHQSRFGNNFSQHVEDDQGWNARVSALNSLKVRDIATSSEDESEALKFFGVAQDVRVFHTSEEEEYGEESEEETRPSPVKKQANTRKGWSSQAPNSAEEGRSEEDDVQHLGKKRGNARKRLFSKRRKSATNVVESEEEVGQPTKPAKKKVTFNPQPEFKMPSPPQRKVQVQEVTEKTKRCKNDDSDDAPVVSTPRECTTRSARAAKPKTLLQLSYKTGTQKKSNVAAKYLPPPSNEQKAVQEEPTEILQPRSSERNSELDSSDESSNSDQPSYPGVYGSGSDSDSE